MRLLSASLAAVLVTACAAPSPAGSSPPLAPATSATAEPSSTTATTAAPIQATYTVTGCETPPVTFALLCDVYAYLDQHYVEELDPEGMGAAFALGVDRHPGEPAAPIQSFQCAIPDPAFESGCERLSERLGSTTLLIEEAVEAGVGAMIDLSLDPFTHYFPPELAGAVSPDGVVLAVSLLLSIRDPAGSECVVVQAPCRLEVAAALPEGPAFAAGLRTGDVITRVDGTEVAGLGLVEAAALLAGDPGSVVEVVTAESGSITVTRESFEFPTGDFREMEPGIGYLRIPDFDFMVPAFVHGALASLLDAGVDTIVIDLRDNPGGYLDAVTLVGSEFLNDGLIFRTSGPEGDLEYPVQPGGLATADVALSVVVNGGSASAAEILAASLQESGRATVVGDNTFGKNTVQVGFPLRNDGELRVTIARWSTPDGESVAVAGLSPDVVVDIPPDASPAEVVELALGS